METLTRQEEAQQVKASRIARLRNRVATVLAILAGLVAVPAAAFAQTTSPSLPDATQTANNLVNNGGSQIANVAVAVLPTVIGVLVLFWAIRFALKKVGMRGSAHI